MVLVFRSSELNASRTKYKDYKSTTKGTRYISRLVVDFLFIMAKIKHNMTKKHPLYRVWCTMKERCNNKNNNKYKNYGGRGIKVCDEWQKDFTIFYNWAISNGYEKGLTIERINVNGNYCPENCTWITAKEQCYNKQNTIKVFYKNNEIKLKEFCDKNNLNYYCIYQRIFKLKWSADDAIDKKIKLGNNQYKL